MNNTNIINIACGTDDGISFTKKHFGSAGFYMMYTLNLEDGAVEFVRRLKNNSLPEETHGDIKKAQSVSEMLKDVQALVGFVFGPNIIHIRKRFVPIISREVNINDALKKLNEKINDIQNDLKIPEGNDKDIIYVG